MDLVPWEWVVPRGALEWVIQWGADTGARITPHMVGRHPTLSHLTTPPSCEAWWRQTRVALLSSRLSFRAQFQASLHTSMPRWVNCAPPPPPPPHS